MKAIVVEQPGDPEVLKIKNLPRPDPRPGWVLIRVKAFGLNRAELFTRQGHSPGVSFPRVLGIECVGEVEKAPATDLTAGQTVAAVMGGMGRAFDGSYAEYTCVPASHVIPLATEVDWPLLGAIPEMFLTIWGALTDGLEVGAGQSLLVRGGTSSVGLAAISLAKDMGLTVAATTRNAAKADTMRENGVDHVLIDDGGIADAVRRIFPNGVDRVLELVGTVTVRDSLKATAPKGIVCIVGMLGGEWTLESFSPFEAIPSSVKLTTYQGEALNIREGRVALQQFVDGVVARRHRVNLDRVFRFDQIVEAHRYMEENRAKGKLVVLVD
ncbi:MAG: zinc-binding dehydrogenase [candidate division NC10 bacterium]|nr:zinc-binding dehydrogenase [candidate division NC10 bacterium]